MWILLWVWLGLQVSDGAELHEAARRGNLEEVRKLLDSGVDVNAGNRYQATALFFAAQKGNLEMVELLVERGARVDIKDTFYQMTALSRALSDEHFDVVRYLLSKGAPGADDVLRAAVDGANLGLAETALGTGDVTIEAYDQALEKAEGEIRERLLARKTPEAEARSDVALSVEELRVFVDRYRNDADGQTLTVELSGGTLTLGGGPSGSLSPVGERRFELRGQGVSVLFRGRASLVESLVMRQDGVASRFLPVDESEIRETDPPPSTLADLPPVERVAAAPWPEFRGPNRSGIADGQGVPVEWDASSGKNIRFRTELPGFSVSSPVIWGERVFVLTAISSAGDSKIRTGLYGDVTPVEDLSEHRWLLYALDNGDGHIVWERELHRGVPGTKRHPKSSQANATPATDGKHIVTVLGSVGLLLCHDVDGNLLWKKEIGVLNAGWFYDADYQWGHSSSPILYGESAILQADVHNGSFLAAYRLEDGAELWRTPREEVIPTFSTPTVYRGPEGDELVTNGTVVRGYDPKTGAPLWHLGPNSEIPIGAPVVTDDLIYVTAGYPPIRPIYAIRPGSRGDLALPEGADESEALAWSKNRGGTYIPSPLVYGDYFYTNANNGRLTCYDRMTGERVYRARIGGVGGSYAASPIAADGRMYFTNEDGETFVVRAGSKYELLQKNSVDETVLSTPAASNGLLVIRGLTHVYGISNE